MTQREVQAQETVQDGTVRSQFGGQQDTWRSTQHGSTAKSWSWRTDSNLRPLRPKK